jgi:hypothetical protein
MNNKISTFDDGLDYLYLAKKESRADFFGLAKLDMFKRLLGILGGMGKMRQKPWMTMAYAVCVSLIAGAITRKILAAKREKL